MDDSQPYPALPRFLRLAGHPLRWSILCELARSDLQVSELTRLLGERQNLVSYHLARLRSEQLVTARRSAHDGRHAYYRTDLDRCAELLATSGRALHPGVDLAPVRRAAAPGALSPARVLFLCTGNSARSQMAEALLNHTADGAMRAVSAGDQPRSVHPNAVRAMAVSGIDISAHRAKHTAEFASQHFDHVVTLCDHVRERCPEFPRAAVRHWSIADPVDFQRPDDDTYPAFESVARELATRIGYFLALAHEP